MTGKVVKENEFLIKDILSRHCTVCFFFFLFCFLFFVFFFWFLFFWFFGFWF